MAPPVRPPDPLAGTYVLRGGGGALETVTALTSAFSAIHPGVRWEGFEDVGSDAAVKLAASGDADLGFISRDLRTAEIGTVLTMPIGRSGTALAVSVQNPVTGLSKDQLAKMFSGEIADWKDVGGDPGAIRILLREAGSAVRNAVESYIFGGKPVKYARNIVEVTSGDETIKALGSFRDSIGMLSLTSQAYASPTIRLLAIDGVAATRDTVANGTYKMLRPLYLVYNRDPAKVKPAIKSFLAWVESPDGQKVLAGL